MPGRPAVSSRPTSPPSSAAPSASSSASGSGGVQVTPAADSGGDDGDPGRDGGEGEGQVHAVREGLLDQPREERPAGDVGDLVGGQVLQRAGRAEQFLDRVVAEERREQAADRRLAGHEVGGAAGLTPAAVRPLYRWRAAARPARG